MAPRVISRLIDCCSCALIRRIRKSKFQNQRSPSGLLQPTNYSPLKCQFLVDEARRTKSGSEGRLTENSFVFGNSKSAGVVIGETRTVASISMLIPEATVKVGLYERNEAGENQNRSNI